MEKKYEERVIEALNSYVDLFGLEVLAGGEPSYDRIKDYLRPLKLAKWRYQFCPLILTDVAGAVKARVLYEGAAIHLNIHPSKEEEHYHLPRFSAQIMVGESEEAFGSDESRLDGPTLQDGFLPIYQWTYQLDGICYRQTVFALEEPDAGLTIHWKMESDAPGIVTVRFEGGDGLHVKDIRLLNASGDCVARFGPGGEFNPDDASFRFSIGPGRNACLAIPNTPAQWDAVFKSGPVFTESALNRCLNRWKSLLLSGADIEVPEPIVNTAWKALLLGTVGLMNNDSLRYSAHNGYQKQYANEIGTGIVALGQFGLYDLARRAADYMFIYEVKPNTHYNAASWRLRHLLQYALTVGDFDYIEKGLDFFRSYADFIVDGRKLTEETLLPREVYAGDLQDTRVFNSRTHANCWRGLRDFAAVLKLLGRTDEAERYAAEAADFRRVVLDAIEKSVVPDGSEVFIPMALLEGEQPFDRLPDSEQASYYNVVIPMLYSSGIFPPGSPRLMQLQSYQENRGGIMLGLLRFAKKRDIRYPSHDGLDDPYGLPYTLHLLNTGQIDKFLLSFYGKLAHTFTRDTWLGAECTSVIPVEGEYYRKMGQPPNSFSNAMFLQSLRCMLVLEQDMDDDGIADQLHLASGTPRAWLEPGKEIQVKRLPSMFGVISFQIQASSDGQSVIAVIQREHRFDPKKLTLTLRLSDGKQIRSIQLDNEPLNTFDAGSGKITLPADKSSYRLLIKIA